MKPKKKQDMAVLAVKAVRKKSGCTASPSATTTLWQARKCTTAKKTRQTANEVCLVFLWTQSTQSFITYIVTP